MTGTVDRGQAVLLAGRELDALRRRNWSGCPVRLAALAGAAVAVTGETKPNPPAADAFEVADR
ncbi:MAG: hypothetical protein KDJ73_07080 [Notoacmeibacter sp.]|nr:hypothetical protein [Notoacmeibacter sp.]MCC0033571.1 hypothetical protein [Brucellaceae bacterium]